MAGMENIVSTNNNYLNNENIYDTILNIETEKGKINLDEVNYGLTVRDGKNFFRYLKNFNLSKDPDLLILPPNNHYYFDENELKNVRTLVNLKNLNSIKDLNSFLFTLVRLLPPNANFVGYFSYNKFSLTGDNLFTGLSTRINKFLDLKTDHNLDKKEFSERLQKFGFRIIDMTEINGFTFFYTQKKSNESRLTA
jgi:hypothetical protein